MSSLINTVKQEAVFLQRVFVDVGFKEAYFFAKNSWGMLVHPQLTTGRIFKNKDYPQFFLVFGFPLNVWLVGAVFLGLVRLLGLGGEGWRLVHKGFVVLTGLLAVLSLYYASWVWRYERRIKALKEVE